MLCPPLCEENLFFSGGGSNIERLVSGTDHSAQSINKLFYGNFNISEFNFNLGFAYHLLAIIVALTLRLFGIIGLLVIIFKRQYWLLSVSIFPILYLTPLYGFIGQSRFRIPLEPSLAIFSAVGLVAAYQFINNKYYNKS